MKQNKIYTIGKVKLFLYESSVFFACNGKILIVPNLQVKITKLVKRIKNTLFNLVFDYNRDIDCDGMSESTRDKLTNGKIYYKHAWNFSRAGGSFGYTLDLFGKEVKGIINTYKSY